MTNKNFICMEIFKNIIANAAQIVYNANVMKF